MTSRVTSRVSTRVRPPPPMKIFPAPKPLLAEPLPEAGPEDDFFPTAPAAPINPPPKLLSFAEGFGDDDGEKEDLEEDLDADLLFEEEEPDSPFILDITKNRTATITTAASVTNTMIAVKRMARGTLYNS